MDTPGGGRVLSKSRDRVQLRDETRGAFAQLVRDELLALFEGDDPLVAQTLLKARGIIDASLPLLQKGPPRRSRRGYGAMNVISPFGESLEDYGLDPDAEVVAPVGETFGHTMTRQIVAAISSLAKPPPTLQDLVVAAAEAKKAGLADLEKDLREQVAARLAPNDPAPPAAPPPPSQEVAAE